MVDWQKTSEHVTRLFRPAKMLQDKLVSAETPSAIDSGYAYWHPIENRLSLVRYGKRAARAVGWMLDNTLQIDLADAPPDRENWIRIKRAGDGSWMNAPFRWAGLPTGGETAMGNAIVGSLLGGLGGYGMGTLLEQFLPEQYFNRGKLRKTLGIMGLGLGATPGIIRGVSNYSISPQQDKNWWRAIAFPDSMQVVDPDWQQSMQNYTLSHDPKQAAAGTGLELLKPVPVDAFNRAIWNDVHNLNRSSQSNIYGTRGPYSDNSDIPYTPPAVAAATSGLVTGIQQMYGGPEFLTPIHFMRGLASAGTDMITARVAGGILGSLGGLKPEAQKKLQDMGVWSGLIRGVAGSVFGL